MEHFPITHKGKIYWWEEHKDYLKNKYGIPKPDANGYFEVSFWDIGSGYKIDHMTDEDSDLLCFDDMKTKANCIKKKRVFVVSLARNGGLQFR
ncbi:hypothetical protein VRK_39560 [Vibrio sp. MEBiC08052]|nr:hypothetical protein VRK_39560 [Vibrio sp. MEBiC08052]